MPALKTPTPGLDKPSEEQRRSPGWPHPAKISAVRLSRRRRENRAHIRVPSSLPVNVKFGGIYELLGQTLDLSARGMLFELNHPLTPGTPVELVFRLPQKLVGAAAIWLRCQARIVRIENDKPPHRFRLAAKILSYETFRVF